MTPSLILSLPPVPGDAVAASPIAPVLPASPESGGGAEPGADAFAALLAGLEGPAIPVPVAANLPAPAGGAALPDERQDVAGSGEPMLDCDTGLPVLPGLNDPPGLPTETAPRAPVALPRPVFANLPERVAADTRSDRLHAAAHARPLPMPAEAIALVPEAVADPETPVRTPGARRRELPLDAPVAPDAPLPVETPRPVALRVADTPAIERAAAALDPVRVPSGGREPTASETVPALPVPEGAAPDAVPTPPPPGASAPPTVAGVEPPAEAPAAAEAGEAPPPKAEPAPAAAAKPELPPAFAGLTPAQPRPNAARPLPPGQRFEPAAGQPAIVPLAPAAAPPPPVEPLPLEPVTAPRAPGFGFHPATPVAVRAAEAVAPPPLPVDTGRADWLQAMIERIGEIRTAEGHRGAQIRLLPDALGPVDIRIEQRDSQVHVTLAAETAQARQLLAEAAPRLQDMAEAKGLRLTQSSVDSGAGQGRRQPPEAAPDLRRAPASARADRSTPSPARDRIA